MIIVVAGNRSYILDGVEEEVARCLLEEHNPLTISEIARKIYGNYTESQRNYILNLVKKMEKKGIVKLEKRSGIYYVHKNFRPVYLSLYYPFLNIAQSAILLSIATLLLTYYKSFLISIIIYIVAITSLLITFHDLLRLNPQLFNIIKNLYKRLKSKTHL